MQKDRLYADYGAYHPDSRNRAAHAAGIPLVVFGLLGLLAHVHAGPVDLAVVAAIAVLLYYATIDVRGSAISAVTWQAALGAFILGWVFQLIGHRLEGNNPKFPLFPGNVWGLTGPKA